MTYGSKIDWWTSGSGLPIIILLLEEVIDISECIYFVNANYYSGDVVIFTDSKATVKLLCGESAKIVVVLNCKRKFCALSKIFAKHEDFFKLLDKFYCLLYQKQS